MGEPQITDAGIDATHTFSTLAEIIENILEEPRLAALIRYIGQIEDHPNGAGPVNVVSRIIMLMSHGKEDFIDDAKQAMQVGNSKTYDRFLHNIWEKYLKDFSKKEKMILDSTNISEEMNYYRSILQDIRLLAIQRNYETWPYILREGEIIDDF